MLPKTTETSVVICEFNFVISCFFVGFSRYENLDRFGFKFSAISMKTSGIVDKLQNRWGFQCPAAGEIAWRRCDAGTLHDGRGGNFVGDDIDKRALLMDFCGINNLMVGDT